MRKRIIAILGLTCFLVNSGFAQLQALPSGTITGHVEDVDGGTPVEYANIAVYQLPDSLLVSGGLADENGDFIIEQVPYGDHYVEVSFMGYESFRQEATLSKETPNVQLETIQLGIAAAQAEMIEVEVERSDLQLGIDKKVFDVEKSQLAKGGTALDVMRNVPTLDVDMNGNVSLRGSQGVKVLINGKPSALTGMNQKAVLQQIPASAIKSVEIITNPSAKYDPEGMAGIINIVLKKNTLEGFSGNASFSMGTPADKYNTGISLAYQKGKFNIFGSYNFGYNRNRHSNSFFREEFQEGTTTSFFDRAETGRNFNTSHFAKVGVDYNINDNNSISLTASINPYRGGDNGNYDYIRLTPFGATDYTMNRVADESYTGWTQEYNLITIHNFKKEGHKLEFFASYADSDTDSDNFYDQTINTYQDNGNITSTTADQQFSIDNNKMLSGQLDYTLPVGKTGQLEAGTRVSLRTIDNDFQLDWWDYDAGTSGTDLGRSNHFIYDEQIYAGYLTFGQQLGAFGYQAGLRMEQTMTTSELVTTNESYDNNYPSFFPSLHLSYQLAETQQLQLSYSRRIRRPSVGELNPFISYSDPFNIHVGDPLLKPEYTNSIELTYAKYTKWGAVTGSVYYRHTQDVIRRMKDLTPEGIGRVYYTNFDQTQSYGAELMVNARPTKWMRLNASVNLYTMQEDASNISGDFQQSAFLGQGSLNGTFTLGKGFEAQMNIFYRSPMVIVIGKIKPMIYTGFGVSKTFLDETLTVSLRVQDPFNIQQFAYDLNDNTYHEIGAYRWESRVAWLTIDYNFGKMDMKTRRRLQNGRRSSGGGGGGGF